MEEKRALLAILGRGIQKTRPNGPWDLTEDIEVCDENFAHLPVRVPQNDDHSNSIVGGGQLNLLAGVELTKILRPAVVVCAYGFRSKYLKENDAPSESRVMSEKFDAIVDLGGFLPVVDIFNEQDWQDMANLPSNTRQELYNVFAWAVTCGIPNVAVVTVGVHCARSLLFAHEHLAAMPEFKDLKLQFYRSENVLLQASPDEYRKRITPLRESKSFERTLEIERNGISGFLRDKYKSVQETVSK